MAIIKLADGFDEIKGVLGGSILSYYNNTQTIRMRPPSHKVSSPYQLAANNRLGYVASTWRNLTPSQQAVWAGQTANYPYLDKFGVYRDPSAYQLYCAFNINRLLMGYDIITAVGAPLSYGTNEPMAWTYNSPTDIRFTASPAFTTVCQGLMYATCALSPGQQTPRTNYRQIHRFFASSTSDVNVYPYWSARFGQLLPGSVIFFKAVVLSASRPERFLSQEQIVQVT